MTINKTFSIKVFLIYLLIIASNIIGQNKNENKFVTIHYNDSCKEDYIIPCYKGKFDKKVIISFDYGFNDSIKIKFMKKLIFNDFVITEKSSSTTGKAKEIDYKNVKDKKFSVNISAQDKPNLVLAINPKYYLILVSFYEKKWRITYTNQSGVYD